MTLVLNGFPAFIMIIMPIVVNHFYKVQKNQAGLSVANEIDFIVVGGGTTGAVVANRLSKKFNVLLLERGGHPGPDAYTRVPFFADIVQKTKMAHIYKTVPLPNLGLAFTSQKQAVVGAKSLGGMSVLNHMMYVRGHKEDYENWSKITKSKIWKWKNVLKYFKKSENYHGNYPGSQHSVGGELYVGKNSFNPPLRDIFLKAFQEYGINTGDINVRSGTVFGIPDVTIRKAERWGAYNAFIKPILGRNKLTICTFCQATKVHLSGSTRATGVSYRHNGKIHFVRAKMEVILSAGVIETPKLLMISGIGQKQQLKSFGIKPLVDLPVGQFYTAQTFFQIPFLINKRISFVVSRDLNLQNLEDYYLLKNGPLSTLHTRSVTGYLNTSADTNPKWPSVYALFDAIGGDGFPDPSRKYKSNVYNTYFKPIKDRDGFNVEIANTRVRSQGSIKLASKKIDDPPIIDPNFFSDPLDMQRSIEGAEFIVNFVENSNTMQSIGAHLPNMPFPGCEMAEYKSKDYWECYIRQLTGDPCAASSSCRMGDGSEASKQTAVVDPFFRVLGVKGLRVVDASAMPQLPTGTPYATVIMMGEVGSQLIIDHWENKRRRT